MTLGEAEGDAEGDASAGAVEVAVGEMRFAGMCGDDTLNKANAAPTLSSKTRRTASAPLPAENPPELDSCSSSSGMSPRRSARGSRMLL